RRSFGDTPNSFVSRTSAVGCASRNATHHSHPFLGRLRVWFSPRADVRQAFSTRRTSTSLGPSEDIGSPCASTRPASTSSLKRHEKNASLSRFFPSQSAIASPMGRYHFVQSGGQRSSKYSSKA